MSPTALTIGTFDGVHRGHMAVIDCLKAEARRHGLIPMAVTFDRHPLTLIRPGNVPPQLTTTARRDLLLRNAGVEPVEVKFTEEVRRLTARQWMRELKRRYGMQLLVMGYDNTFGSDGLGLDYAKIAEIGKEEGVEVVKAPIVAKVSSSEIRRAVTGGDIDRANAMLGRPYRLDGTVESGESVGHLLGWPTANLRPEPGSAVPGVGVYAAWAITPDGRRHEAMVNIGHRPTLYTQAPVTIEAHLLGYEGNLYNKPMSLIFLKRLRDEKKFNSIDELRQAIKADSNATRDFFANERMG